MTSSERILAGIPVRPGRQPMGFDAVNGIKALVKSGELAIARDGSALAWDQDRLRWVAMPVNPAFDPCERKIDRVEHANQVLAAIARHGRRFFYSREHDRVARFELDVMSGRVWFRDEWRWQRVWVAKRGEWRGFHHGGTLKHLVECLYDYIRTGYPVSAYLFGPWSQELCNGDLWGYGQPALVAMRAELAANPAVASWTACRRHTITRW